jgi:hypothetical protein
MISISSRRKKKVSEEERIGNIIRRHSDELFASGAKGIHIGMNPTQPDKLCIVVFVKSLNTKIPKEIEGVFVDIVESNFALC